MPTTTIRMILRDGTTYTLDNDGYVLDRSDGPRGWDYSRKWRILGFARRASSRSFIPLEEALIRHVPGKDDAGPNRSTCGHGFVIDDDHGHMRMWGSPSGRRLKSIWREERHTPH